MVQKKIIGARNSLAMEDGKLWCVRTQELPDSYLRELSEVRAQRPKGELRRVASIPAVVVEQMLREGFNVFAAEAKEIVSWLRRKNLTAFVVANP